jgi:serine phosphatase RsbU (regulator of sigma subunit)
MGEKKRHLFESLALRVFLISFMLVVVPLLIYSLYMARRIYKEKVAEVMKGLTLFTEDQVHYIQQLEINYSNFLEAFYNFDLLIEPHYQTVPDELIAPILEKMATEGNATAFFYLNVEANGDLVCHNSTTLKLYKGINFTPYFSLDFLEKSGENIFIAKDPIFFYSLYLTFLIKDKSGKTVSVLAASVALEQLLDTLLTLRTAYETNISILSQKGEVIASTLPSFLNKDVAFVTEVGEDSSKIYIEKIEGPENQYRFSFEGKERFAVVAPFPLTDAILLVTIPMDVPLQEMYRYMATLGALLLFMMLLGGGGSFLLTVRMAKPLRQLQGVMQKVGEGTLTARFNRDSLGFEINHLGENFNDMVTSLVGYIEAVKKEKAEKEAYAKELQIGHEIQKSILPSEAIDFKGLGTKIFFQSAKEVAGDFYDWLVRGDEIFITVADGVGKGIQGCLYAFDLRSILRTAMSEEGDLGKIVKKSNELFCHDTKETGNFVTAFIVLYNRVDHKIKFANCGHNQPLVKRTDGTIDRLVGKGIAFGVDEMAAIEIGERVFQSGEILVLYTDGINEAKNEAGALYTQERLESLIQGSSNNTPETLASEVLEDIKKFVGKAEPYDDMTLIILKVE